MLEFQEENWSEVLTPINVEVLRDLLGQTGYPQDKSDYLINGFMEGFDIGYRGPLNRKKFVRKYSIEAGDRN